MKFLSLALLAVGVSAQTMIEPIDQPSSDAAPAPSSTSIPKTGTSSCEADYIVERCLSTETDKVEACDATDYDCQCAAYEAIATCYNNCPNDPRASSAQNQVLVFCQQASLHNTKTTTTSKTGTETTAAPTATSDDEDDESGTRESNTATFESENPEETGAAGEVFVNAGGALVAVAGAIAALL